MLSARFLKLMAAALALVLTGAAAQADPPRWRQDGRERAPYHQRSQRSVNDVIGEVENRYGGKVVGVQQTGRDHEVMYRVRVLQRDGRVKTLMVPAGARH